MIALRKTARLYKRICIFSIQSCKQWRILATWRFLHWSWLICQSTGKTRNKEHKPTTALHLWIGNIISYQEFLLFPLLYIIFNLLFLVLRALGPVDCKNLRNKMTMECIKMEDSIMNTWFPKVINLLTSKETLSGIKEEKMESFFNCASTLMSNQVGQQGLCQCDRTFALTRTEMSV